jgi:hypothetical protein
LLLSAQSKVNTKDFLRNARTGRTTTRAAPEDNGNSRRSNDQDHQDEDQGQDPADTAVEAANQDAPAAVLVPAPRVPVAEARNPAEAD